jgi:hypothetical protein
VTKHTEFSIFRSITFGQHIVKRVLDGCWHTMALNMLLIKFNTQLSTDYVPGTRNGVATQVAEKIALCNHALNINYST